MSEAATSERKKRCKVSSWEPCNDLLIMAFAEHFPGIVPNDENENDLIKCEECADYKSGVCEGEGLRGTDVIIKCLAPSVGLEAKVSEAYRKGRYKNYA